MYCTYADIEESYTENTLAQLTDDVNGTVVNSEIVVNFIGLCSNIIDDYLRGTYSLPLKNEHSILKKICICFVRYELAKRRTGVAEDDFEHIEYKDALSLLKDIQCGKITLDEPAEEATKSSAVVEVRTKPEIFKRQNIMDLW